MKIFTPSNKSKIKKYAVLIISGQKCCKHKKDEQTCTSCHQNAYSVAFVVIGKLPHLSTSEAEAALPPFGPIEGHNWFFQI